MPEQYYVRTIDLESEEETVDGPFPTELAAVTYAESRAEEFYGGDDVTWFKKDGSEPSYLVGRISEDGVHSGPIVRLVVDEEEVEIEEDPAI